MATSFSFGFYLCALRLQVRFLTTSTLVFAKLDAVLHAVGFEKRLLAAHMEKHKLDLEKDAEQKVSWVERCEIDRQVERRKAQAIGGFNYLLSFCEKTICSFAISFSCFDFCTLQLLSPWRLPESEVNDGGSPARHHYFATGSRQNFYDLEVRKALVE